MGKGPVLGRVGVKARQNWGAGSHVRCFYATFGPGRIMRRPPGTISPGKSGRPKTRKWVQGLEPQGQEGSHELKYEAPRTSNTGRVGNKPPGGSRLTIGWSSVLWRVWAKTPVTAGTLRSSIPTTPRITGGPPGRSSSFGFHVFVLLGKTGLIQVRRFYLVLGDSLSGTAPHANVRIVAESFGWVK